MTKKIYHSRYDVICNTTDLQSDSCHVNTCGRWVVVRYIYREEDIDDFVNYFMHIPSNTRDYVVTQLYLEDGRSHTKLAEHPEEGSV